jgi:hypothetical protein
MIHTVPTPETPLAKSPQERRNRNKAFLLNALKAAGAVRAMVSYSGESDQGSVYEIRAVGADETPIDLPGTVSLLVEHSHFAEGQWQSSIVREEQLLEDALTIHRETLLKRFNLDPGSPSADTRSDRALSP